MWKLITIVALPAYFAGLATIKYLDSRDDDKFDKVGKGAYTLNSDINEKYVPIQKYSDDERDIAQLKQKLEVVTGDNPDVPELTLKNIRTVEIFEKDTVDYYGLIIHKSNSLNDLIEVKDFVKNLGFQNTEVFKVSDSNYYLISFGFACVGSGIKKAKKKIEAAIKTMGLSNVSVINLTTIAPNGFIPHTKTSFEYFAPRYD